MFRFRICSLQQSALAGARCGRAFCTEKAPRPPKPRGDSEFVKRRRTYREEMHEMRKRFAGELGAAKDTTRTTSSPISGDQKELHEQRMARKRERKQRIKEHEERLKEIQETKQKRRAFKKAEWERRQKALFEQREAVINMLVEHADTWVTEDNLDKHVEQAVDEFFIEGVADARRNNEAQLIGGPVRGAMRAY